MHFFDFFSSLKFYVNKRVSRGRRVERRREIQFLMNLPNQLKTEPTKVHSRGDLGYRGKERASGNVIKYVNSVIYTRLAF